MFFPCLVCFLFRIVKKVGFAPEKNPRITRWHPKKTRELPDCTRGEPEKNPRITWSTPDTHPIRTRYAHDTDFRWDEPHPGSSRHASELHGETLHHQLKRDALMSPEMCCGSEPLHNPRHSSKPQIWLQLLTMEFVAPLLHVSHFFGGRPSPQNVTDVPGFN